MVDLINYKGNSRKRGVYLILNKENSKVYIGSTITMFKNRKTDHLRDLFHNRRYNIRFLEDYNRLTDKSNLLMYILEIISEDKPKEYFLQREKYYIELFESYREEKGYNTMKDPFTFRGRKIPTLYKIVSCYDKGTGELIRTFNSMSEASKISGTVLSALTGCIKAKGARTAAGYLWAYGSEEQLPYTYTDKYH